MAPCSDSKDIRLTTLEEIITGLQGALEDDQQIVAVVQNMMTKGCLRRPANTKYHRAA